MLAAAPERRGLVGERGIDSGPFPGKSSRTPPAPGGSPAQMLHVVMTALHYQRARSFPCGDADASRPR